MSKYFLLLLLTIVAYSYADIPKCNRQIAPITGYDRSKIRGTWYVIEVGNELKSKKRCLNANVTFEKIFESGFVNGKLDELDITLRQLESKSQYIAESREFPPAIVSVVDTDYSSYGVWFLCRNNHPQGGVLFITTRTRQPGADVIEKTHKSLINAGFKSDKLNLFTVDQSNC
ncbi:uncharacterized protein [Onthophagus taurus]|uniref:uncharacterized protein n=1 Tax=Onthophagus taurus TaxID=166361 RepID=UPI000C20B20E|nr:uncharacterized protein LOC111413817 [Onthophagus taurus]